MTVTQRSSWWWGLRLATAAVACLLALLATAGSASAHASLVGSDPADGSVLRASPGQARFTFDEGVSLPDGGVHVFDATGRNVEASGSTSDKVLTVDLPDRLARGTYVVAWRVVSADGHPVVGSLTFSVGAPSPQVTPPPTRPGSSITPVLSVVHVLTYVGLLLSVGLAIFVVFLLPQSRVDRPLRRIRQIATASTGTAIAATLLGLPLTVVDQRGDGLGDLLSAFAWTGGSATSLLAAGLLVLGLALVRASIDDRQRVVLGLGIALAIVAPALAGHTRAFQPQVPVIAVDVLHVLAGSTWLGGLVGLALTLPALTGRSRDAAAMLTRFSTMGASILGALVVTGMLLAWRIVGSWNDLFGTSYGRVLLVKVGLVGVAAGLAAWNRLVLLPRVRDDGDHHLAQRAAAVSIGRVVSAEAGVLVLVLALTGFLVDLSPRDQGDPKPGNVQTTRLGGVTVRATMSPARVGRNTLRIDLRDATGKPVTPGRLTTSLRSDGLDLGVVPVTRMADGYRAEVLVPSAGTWRLQVSVRLSEFENPVGVLTFAVGD